MTDRPTDARGEPRRPRDGATSRPSEEGGIGLAWFVARRYLAPRKRGRLLSFITWISLGGVTVGVTALIVVLGVMNGMQEELRDKILGSTPHVMVLEARASLRMDDWRAMTDSVKAAPDVEAVAPFISSKVAIVRARGGERFAEAGDLWGVSLEMDPADAPTRMEEEVLQGVIALQRSGEGLPGILFGSRLASRMGILEGDTVTIIALENIRPDPAFGVPRPAMRHFQVAGTFTTGHYEYDIRNIYASIEEVQGLLGISEADQVSGLSVRVADPWQAPSTARRIMDHIGPGYVAETWITQNQALFAALQLEKLVLGVILFLIVVVAAFNIVSTLVMVVVDRTSEIGILKSMGMSDAQVLRVFLFQGLAIGVLGTALGTSLGLLVSWVQHRFQIVRIPADVYFIDHLPVSVNPFDLGLIVAGSLLIALLATIYPALQASRLQPVEAIKHV